MTGERNTTAWTIEQMRAIVGQRGFGTVQVDDRPVNILDLGAPEDLEPADYDMLPYAGLMIVDMQTANAIVTVYDALSEEHRARLLSLPVEKAAKVAWRCVRPA